MLIQTKVNSFLSSGNKFSKLRIPHQDIRGKAIIQNLFQNAYYNKGFI
ncbi:unnamed protein product [Paramecium sonneborni]|uniref:Uncharacterized protein n=1 Tax=Paramecium sonneborni TaxID=65129 RepID=A0A8S1PGX1_9CILI|nr:unnamed protein product [Paramecium sonneborni]